MATDDTEDREIASSGVRAKAERAKQELSLTAEISAGLRAAMLERLVKTSPSDTAMQHRLIAGVQIIDALREALQQAVNAGESAKLYDTLLDQALTGQGPRQGR